MMNKAYHLSLNTYYHNLNKENKMTENLYLLYICDEMKKRLTKLRSGNKFNGQIRYDNLLCNTIIIEVACFTRVGKRKGYASTPYEHGKNVSVVLERLIDTYTTRDNPQGE